MTCDLGHRTKLATLAVLLALGACNRGGDPARRKTWMARHCFDTPPKTPRDRSCQRCTISDAEYTELTAKGAPPLPPWIRELGGVGALSIGVDICEEK